jgi:hypothetical protein
VAGETGARVRVFLQGASGGFTTAPDVPVDGDPRGIAVGDFDRDGNQDLAVMASAADKVNLRFGTGEGTFATRVSVADLSYGADLDAIAVADVNGDGKEDLVVSGRYPNPPHRIYVALGAGNGSFPSGAARDDGAGALAIADFDADAIEDLAYPGLGAAPNGNVVFGSGSGLWRDPAPISLPQKAAFRRGWAVGDFDGDSNADVVAALEKDVAAVRLGTGGGAFRPAPDVSVGPTPQAVAVGDLDSDGSDDLVITEATGKAARIRLGDGAGGFTAAPDVAVGGNPVDVAVADLNSDGNQDLAVANRYESLSVHFGTGTSPLAGNLLVNGGFEGPMPSGRIQPNPPVPGWEVTGAGYVRYSTSSHVYVPSWQAAARFGGPGGRMLSGGASAATNGVTTATQTVDVAGSAAEVDARRATARLSTYLGGATVYDDTMAARATFLDAAGAELGSLTIGPVTAAARRNLTTLLPRAGEAPVPAGTRRIRVTLTSTDADKTYSSALADNAKLTLSVAPPAEEPTTPASSGSDPPPPPPPPPVARFGSRTLVSLSLAQRRVSRRRPVRVRIRVRNGNAFAVTGTLRAAGSTRPLRLAPNGAATIAVALPARLRRVLVRRRAVVLRLSATVRDPAGTARVVRRRVRARLRPTPTTQEARR